MKSIKQIVIECLVMTLCVPEGDIKMDKSLIRNGMDSLGFYDFQLNIAEEIPLMSKYTELDVNGFSINDTPNTIINFIEKELSK